MTEDVQTYEEAMAEAIELGLMSPNGQATDRCQCPTCGEVFTTEGNFDRHLMPGRNVDGYDGPWCRPPSEVGLVQTEGHRWWHQPDAEGPVLGRMQRAGARRGVSR
jgi:hypothetical protein